MLSLLVLYIQGSDGRIPRLGDTPTLRSIINSTVGREGRRRSLLAPNGLRHPEWLGPVALFFLSSSVWQSILLNFNIRIESGAPTTTSLQYPLVWIISYMCVLLGHMRLHSALLYYDYVLTLDRECHLFWSRRITKQWGPVLFFVNRCCGILGHIPVITQMVARPKSSLYSLCKPEYLYHQILVVIIQTIIGGTLLCATATLSSAESELTPKQ